ncbi:nucleotidyl transferase AbiEii/AbiGii toxin family protein [Natronosporangium hydrolyticum]|uniref:Nucleotidyl transferase AbiEii/AbiGii toxin family protein n=1 Tax=Natronosporangium hydrolyticum TaxID=2811111 RepID=A0A895YF19_9ACTN|nr:nucleotidyl transferase AbiEii/AbiGii toxin family protein [Natronosporangium hydrolyticum]QSB16407.1 nucleotidyl transferase AbiEii/AbiGii toxin family protein [Natronosporangium hydrolyticum]
MELAAVLESASRLQELVPDAVLVGGSAAALYASHRDSFDHDHVVGDLRDRFDLVLEALESEGEWVTNRVRPGKIILGRLGDIEAGVRQLIRSRPLETTEVQLPSGRSLRVPTAEETLRIKAFLIVRRNQTRDYLDVAALADRYDIGAAAEVLARIDDYYADQHGGGRGVAAQVARQLGDPRPADASTTQQLDAYRNLAPRWHDWRQVRAVCRRLSAAILRAEV